VEHAKDPLFAPSYHSLKGAKEEGYVYIDPAILAAPVIADLEGDGSPELIIAVSYFFDTYGAPYVLFERLTIHARLFQEGIQSPGKGAGAGP